MILTPLLARLVAVVAQVARVSRGFIGTVPTVEPPLRRVTLLADDEVGVTPPASSLPASRMILHRRAPSWCGRRKELERDRARVRDTGRTSASLEGSGSTPGLPSLLHPLRRRLPRTRHEGRLPGNVPRGPSRHGPPHPNRRTGSAEPRDQAAADGVVPWSPVIPARLVPTESGGDNFELYLPTSWTDDPARRLEARIPESVVFQTKIQLAIGMLRRAVANEVPRGVLLADAWYGDEPSFRQAADELALDYAVGINSDNRVWLVDSRGRRTGEPLTVTKLAERLGPKAFRRFTWREGTNRKLSARFAFATVVPAYRAKDDLATRPKVRLVIEQSDDKDKLTFAFVRLSDKTSKKKLIRVLKDRWRIEQTYEDLKGDLGLDHFEGRRYGGWHHHVTVALACYAFTVAERARLFPPAQRRKALHPPVPCAA
jgi:hypothetical protein